MLSQCPTKFGLSASETDASIHRDGRKCEQCKASGVFLERIQSCISPKTHVVATNGERPDAHRSFIDLGRHFGRWCAYWSSSEHIQIDSDLGKIMPTRFLFAFLKQALAAFSLAVMLTACGGGGGGGGSDGGDTELAPELFGTWDVIELEVLAMSTPCPGEIAISPTESFDCSTTVVAFNADGTYVSIDTTDELGNPFDERTEGTWSTDGNMLTITETMEGPDAGNLDPIDPLEPISLTWSVSANRLTTTLDDPLLPTPVTLTLQKR